VLIICDSLAQQPLAFSFVPRSDQQLEDGQAEHCSALSLAAGLQRRQFAPARRQRDLGLSSLVVAEFGAVLVAPAPGGPGQGCAAGGRLGG
jgi:hypothetical protein